MADVIEDVEVMLRRAINFLIQILNHVCRRVNENSHRPLNRRTLVRWLAAFMPIPKASRFRLQASLAAAEPSTMDRWASCGSLVSGFSSASANQLVEEDLGGNIIRYRRGHGDEDIDEDILEDPSFLPNSMLQDSLAMTSTPAKLFDAASTCSAASGDPTSKERLLAMEEELAALRKQIAMLVMAQETSALNKNNTVAEVEPKNLHPGAVPVPASTALDNTSCESELLSRQHNLCNVPEKLSQEPLPAALPPTLVTDKQLSLGGVSFSQQLQQRKKMLSCVGQSTGDKRTNRGREDIPDMATVLKDLGTVKLRAIERSPGGTPRRRSPERDPTDPASIIAQALKKKFSNPWAFSSDSDKENDSFTSDYSSSFGPHNHLKAKKKLTLHNDSSDNWTPESSTLMA